MSGAPKVRMEHILTGLSILAIVVAYFVRLERRLTKIEMILTELCGKGLMMDRRQKKG